MTPYERDEPLTLPTPPPVPRLCRQHGKRPTYWHNQRGWVHADDDTTCAPHVTRKREA